MTTNLHYDVCATVLLILLLVAFSTRKLVKGRTNHFFTAMVICLLLASILDIIGESYGNYIDAESVPIWIRYIIDSCYFIFRNMTVPLFVVYIASLVGIFNRYLRNRTYVLLLFAPFVLMLILLIINAFNGSVFYYDENLVYRRGPLIIWFYVIAAYYCVMVFLELLAVKNLIEFKHFFELLIFIPCNVLAAAIQMKNSSLHIDLFVTAIIFIVISIGVQRPEVFIDYRSNTLSYNAFNNQMRKIYNLGEPTSLLVFKFANHRSINSSVGFDSYTVLIRTLAEKFFEKDRRFESTASLFYVDNGTFVISADTKHEARLLKLGYEMLDFTRSPINLGNLEVMLEPYMCYLRFPVDINTVESLVSFISDIEIKINRENELVNLAEISVTNDFKMRNDMDAIIKRGIMKNGFKMYYQPIYSIKDKKYISAEALIRLIDREYGYVSPALFIPVSEKSGAIHQIGDFVFKDVCRFIASDKFKDLGVQYIELNLSVAQCIETDLITKFNMILIHSGVKSSQINLEITETAVDYDPAITDKNINALSDMGFSFSLDDYGTGYSNIKRVVSLPLDIVKLDKTLVDEIDDPQMWIVITNTVKLLKNMNKKILVEGVENERVFNKFAELGCDYIQGFYFCKPLPEDEFVEFIRKNNGVETA